jgi:hypothetical protein
LYRFPQPISTLGITEVTEKVFAVVVGNVSLPSVIPTAASFAIWTINVFKTTPQAKVLAPIPDGQFLDGFTRFGSDGLLIAGTFAVSQYRLLILRHAWLNI